MSTQRFRFAWINKSKRRRAFGPPRTHRLLGQAALDAERPQSVVPDIRMPGMHGYQVARRIRAEPRYEGMRIIALTGWGQHADRMQSAASGFDHHLTKPADLGMLQALLTGRVV